MISCGFPWCPPALAMVSSPWTSGSVLWALGLPDALLLALLQVPNSVLTFSCWALLAFDLNHVLFSVLYFSFCLTTLIAIHDYSHFVNWEKNKLSKYQVVELWKIFENSSIIDEETGQRGLTNYLGSERELVAESSVEPRYSVPPLCNYGILYFS